jgi:phage shock protein PspC (stress-responsive transcriptional regulator)
MIAGICGGLGNYLGTDPTVIRLVFVLLAVLGPGVIIYLIAWLVVPEESLAKDEVITVTAEEKTEES